MSADPWDVDRLDLAGYLERLGVAVRFEGVTVAEIAQIIERVAVRRAGREYTS